MAFKILKWITGEEETTKEEVVQLQVAKRTHRIGMDKNFRVGKVVFISAKRGERAHILVDCSEMCNTDDGGIDTAHYNLWIYIPDAWKHRISSDLIGRYVAFGFYMQSFRDKDVPNSYTTVLACKFINVIDSEQMAKSLAIDLMESRQFVEHSALKLSNLNNNNNG
jgi:hypothetical protein